MIAMRCLALVAVVSVSLISYPAIADDISQESVKFSATEFIPDNSPQWPVPGMSYQTTKAQLKISLENKSGSRLSIGIVADSFTVGPCRLSFPTTTIPLVADGHYAGNGPGLPNLSDIENNPQGAASQLRLFRKGETISDAIYFTNGWGAPCGSAMLNNAKTVPVSLSLVVIQGNTVVRVPLATNSVPVHYIPVSATKLY